MMRRVMRWFRFLNKNGVLEFVAVVGAIAGVVISAKSLEQSRLAVHVADRSLKEASVSASAALREASASASAALRAASEANEIQKRHNELSLRPYLEFSYRLSGAGNAVHFSVVNRGLGPAIVESVQIGMKKEGAKIYGAEVDEMNELLGANLRETLATTSLSKNQVIAVNQQVDLFKGTSAASANCGPRLRRLAFFENLRVTVKYKSLYDVPYTRELAYRPPAATGCPVAAVN